MKQRIIIKGPKIHDVGYRYFLMTMARRARIRYFDAENIEGAVEVLIESDEKKVTAFKKLVETSHPDRAEVSEISYEDYDGEIWSINEYSQFCTNVQLNKAIPILQALVERMDKTNDNLGEKIDKTNDNLSERLDKTNDNLGDRIDKMNDNLGGKMDQMLNKQDETIEILSDMDEKMDRSLVRQDETVEAINDLKRNDERLSRIESDIQDIKTKIGAR